jgi:hypothetical protein
MAKKISLGALVDKLHLIREEVRAHEAQAKEARKVKDELEVKILAAMLDDQEVEKVTGKLATVTISRLNVPQVEDWQKTERFILRNNALYLYERRISGKAFRELIAERGPRKPIPGIKVFEKVSLNLRSV